MVWNPTRGPNASHIGDWCCDNWCYVDNSCATAEVGCCTRLNPVETPIALEKRLVSQPMEPIKVWWVRVKKRFPKFAFANL